MSETEGDVTCGPLAAADNDRLMRAYQEWLGAGDRVVELFRWRRAGEPASGGIRPSVAKKGSEIIGSVSAVPADVRLRGRPVRAVWQQDSVVGPPARGKGLGKRLVNAAAAGWEMLLAKSTTPPMYALRKSVGFEDVADRTFLVRVLSPRAAGSLEKRFGYALIWLWNLVRGVDRAPGPIAVRAVERFDAAFDEIAERVPAGDEIGLRKTSAYLNWRYVGAPGRTYRILRAEGRGRLRGAAVLRLNPAPGGRAWILDLICDSRDVEAVAALVSASVRELRRSRAGDVRPSRARRACGASLRGTASSRPPRRRSSPTESKARRSDRCSTAWCGTSGGEMATQSCSEPAEPFAFRFIC